MSSALFSKQNLLCRLAEQQHCRKLSMCDYLHTQKMLLYNIIDPKQRVSPLYIYPVYNKQQTANLQNNNIYQHFHCVIVCTQKVLLYDIDNIDPHRGCCTYICIHSVQQAANSDWQLSCKERSNQAKCQVPLCHQLPTSVSISFLRYNI